MKTIVLRVLMLSFFSWAIPAQAALITIKGFTLNTETQIATGNSLEWLRWPETADMSINEALALYQPDGWRLARDQEVVDMFSAFFNLIDWEPALDENTYVGLSLELDKNLVYLWHDFTDIMGIVFNPGPAFSTMLFGEDGDGDGYYRTVTSYYTEYDPVIAIENDYYWYTRDYSTYETGVLLVREPVAEVSSPPSLTLFMAIILFFFKSYRARER